MFGGLKAGFLTNNARKAKPKSKAKSKVRSAPRQKPAQTTTESVPTAEAQSSIPSGFPFLSRLREDETLTVLGMLSYNELFTMARVSSTIQGQIVKLLSSVRELAWEDVVGEVPITASTPAKCGAMVKRQLLSARSIARFLPNIETITINSTLFNAEGPIALLNSCPKLRRMDHFIFTADPEVHHFPEESFDYFRFGMQPWDDNSHLYFPRDSYALEAMRLELGHRSDSFLIPLLESCDSLKVLHMRFSMMGETEDWRKRTVLYQAVSYTPALILRSSISRKQIKHVASIFTNVRALYLWDAHNLSPHKPDEVLLARCFPNLEYLVVTEEIFVKTLSLSKVVAAQPKLERVDVEVPNRRDASRAYTSFACTIRGKTFDVDTDAQIAKEECASKGTSKTSNVPKLQTDIDFRPDDGRAWEVCKVFEAKRRDLSDYLIDQFEKWVRDDPSHP